VPAARKGNVAGSNPRRRRRRENEQHAARAGTSTFLEFACECIARGCGQRVPLMLAEFEAVRAAPCRFVVAPGHFVAAVERLVVSDRRFDVVEAR
jgi:hypothetical protein